MLEIPLSPVPSQSLNIVLGDQNCTINVYTLTTGLFFDLVVDSVPIVTGVLCHDKNLMVNKLYTGFKGDFVFFDAQGIDDPIYTDLGGRFLLIYLDETDVLQA
jgi:hypothetical protein